MLDEDIDGDGLDDLICYFYTQDAEFDRDDTGGILKGETLSGTPLVGGDSVIIIH